MIFSTIHRYILMSFSLIIAIAITSMSVVSATPTWQLLQKCEQHVKADRLTTGRGGNALSCYEAVLKQEPTNSKAWRGLEKIQARYRVLINKAANRGQQNRVRAYKSRIALVDGVKTRLQGKVKYVSKQNEKIFYKQILILSFDNEGKNPKIIKMQEEAIQKIKEIIRLEGINALTKFDRTFLFHAASSGNYEIVDFLIKNGADVNMAEAANLTPLQEAVKSGSLDIVKLLIKNGANIHAEDDFGRTAFSLSIFYQKDDITSYLRSL